MACKQVEIDGKRVSVCNTLEEAVTDAQKSDWSIVNQEQTLYGSYWGDVWTGESQRISCRPTGDGVTICNEQGAAEREARRLANAREENGNIQMARQLAAFAPTANLKKGSIADVEGLLEVLKSAIPALTLLARAKPTEVLTAINGSGVSINTHQAEMLIKEALEQLDMLKAVEAHCDYLIKNRPTGTSAIYAELSSSTKHLASFLQSFSGSALKEFLNKGGNLLKLDGESMRIIRNTGLDIYLKILFTFQERNWSQNFGSIARENSRGIDLLIGSRQTAVDAGRKVIEFGRQMGPVPWAKALMIIGAAAMAASAAYCYFSEDCF